MPGAFHHVNARVTSSVERECQRLELAAAVAAQAKEVTPIEDLNNDTVPCGCRDLLAGCQLSKGVQQLECCPAVPALVADDVQDDADRRGRVVGEQGVCRQRVDFHVVRGVGRELPHLH